MSVKFEKGQTYNTVKTLGVVQRADGHLHVSQRIGKDCPDIDPTENLVFDGRVDGKLWFIREDGSRVIGHRSHFDPTDAYNLVKETSKDVAAIKEKVSKKHAELEAMANQLDALLQEEAAIQAESTPVETFEPVSDEARDEAEALFNEA